MMKILIIVFAVFLALNLNGQNSIQVQEDPRITSLMDQYLRNNRTITQISGWRVTVISTTDRRVMEKTKAEFQNNFNLSTRWEYKEPYYQLKAGAFLNRADATAALESVKKKFSTAFISLDKIPYEEFKY